MNNDELAEAEPDTEPDQNELTAADETAADVTIVTTVVDCPPSSVIVLDVDINVVNAGAVVISVAVAVAVAVAATVVPTGTRLIGAAGATVAVAPS